MLSVWNEVLVLNPASNRSVSMVKTILIQTVFLLAFSFQSLYAENPPVGGGGSSVGIGGPESVAYSLWEKSTEVKAAIRELTSQGYQAKGKVELKSLGGDLFQKGSALFMNYQYLMLQNFEPMGEGKVKTILAIVKNRVNEPKTITVVGPDEVDDLIKKILSRPPSPLEEVSDVSGVALKCSPGIVNGHVIVGGSSFELSWVKNGTFPLFTLLEKNASANLSQKTEVGTCTRQNLEKSLSSLLEGERMVYARCARKSESGVIIVGGTSYDFLVQKSQGKLNWILNSFKPVPNGSQSKSIGQCTEGVFPTI